MAESTWLETADMALLMMADAAPTAAPAFMVPPEKPPANLWPLVAPFFPAMNSALSSSFCTASDRPLIFGMTLSVALPALAGIYTTSSHCVSAIVRLTLAYL